MRSILCLAAVEVKSECTSGIAQIWNLLNKMLCEVSGKERYKFSERYYLLMKQVLTLLASKKNLVKNYHFRIFTCQWHFKNSSQ